MENKREVLIMIKKEGFFSKGNVIWGVGAVVIFSLLSIFLIGLSCKNVFPFPSFCLSKVIFLVLNWFGLTLLTIFHSGFIQIATTKILYKLAILINLPFYYLLGFLSRKLFNKIKNVKKV